MTKKQVVQFNEMHKKINYLIDDMTVNGANGEAPIIGIHAILEHDHNELKVVHKDVIALQDLTRPLKESVEVRKAVKTLAAFFITSLKFWLVISAGILGYIGFNNIAKIVTFVRTIF